VPFAADWVESLTAVEKGLERDFGR